MDQEDLMEMQQPWRERTKEEFYSSSIEIGHGKWSCDIEIE